MKEKIAQWITSHCHETYGRVMNVEEKTALAEAETLLPIIGEIARENDILKKALELACKDISDTSPVPEDRTKEWIGHFMSKAKQEPK